ncbi:MAG: hypothetical protein C4317_06005, partial [Acidimicrobiia bacterium]
GLLAKRAVERGLRVPGWVKTSLAPGSKVVMDYLGEAGLVCRGPVPWPYCYRVSIKLPQKRTLRAKHAQASWRMPARKLLFSPFLPMHIPDGEIENLSTQGIRNYMCFSVDRRWVVMTKVKNLRALKIRVFHVHVGRPSEPLPPS